MSWYRVINKQTGEPQHVQCEGKSLADNYPPDLFDSIKLHREPREHDVFEDGKLRHCPITEVKARRAGKYARMSRVEFFDHIMEEIDKKLTKQETS
jgi:hypothetical protein